MMSYSNIISAIEFKTFVFFQGFVDMIGETFQINANCLPVEGTIRTSQPVSAELNFLKIENDSIIKMLIN